MKFKLITAVALLGLSPLAANADVIVDTTTFHAEGTNSSEDYVDHGCGSVDFLAGWCTSAQDRRAPTTPDFVSWNHLFDLTGVGSLISATLQIWFEDDSGEPTGDWAWLSPEFVFGFTEDGGWDVGEVDTGPTEAYEIDVSALNDGSFFVTVVSLLGDVYITKSVLTINHAKAVPEPSTLALFGLGLLGVGLARRKKAKV